MEESSKISNVKVVKDCIYGHIIIPDLCRHFMDTPEFQRLRRVKQLGMAHYAYPSAVHTRFEHSLGVMHLAGRMVDQLRKFAQISERVKELIQLAGLYHDIGHFCFSHLFDTFLKETHRDNFPQEIFTLNRHEDRSVFFLRKVNGSLRLLSANEQKFVEDVIIGEIADDKVAYLYQIVCNKECNIDIDRQDYLKRDSYHCGFPGFQSDYIIINAGIDAENHIAFKPKARRDLEDLFMTRQRMYENVYLHHTTLKFDKIYFCMMKRLGLELFKFGEQTDDYNVETLMRSSECTKDLVAQLEHRQLTHECDNCKSRNVKGVYKPSGSIDDVRFLNMPHPTS